MNALPEGTVTFLFTDIEGSTRMWEEHPTTMQSALAAHDRLMRREIEAAGGAVFKTAGDAFCAAFHGCKAAVRAALGAQLALLKTQWPEDLTIKVRMAVHVGTAELRDHDYFGPTLNRTARILATAHGGQIILSEAVHTLCLGEQIPGASYVSLGAYRLKDLERPAHIFQLCHAELQSDFPILRALSQDAHNLPVQLTSFVGRENEKHVLIKMLGSCRLVTVAGSGGCGKTRLAQQTAAELVDEFPEGVWQVELAPVTEPAQVPQALADVLGVREEPGTTLTNTLCNALKSRKALLILDNCEHLLTAAAQLTDALLKQCPDVHILASSREGLGVHGEQVYRIPSLSTPPAGDKILSHIEKYESVQLFVERARLHQPEFALTAGNAASVGAVCARLDGIPLAIELAAARARAMSVNEIEKRLDQRFRLLTGGSRTVLPRQQTLRQLIDWSYDLLDEREQTMLQRVSVFMGGWSLECAEQVCSGGDIEEWEVLDLLTSLSDKSLVVVDTVADDELGVVTRYRLLETVRQYSLERLTEAAGATEVRRRHRDWYVSYAKTAEPHLKAKDSSRWLARLSREHENLQNALGWCREEGEQGDSSGTATGLLLAGQLEVYWGVRAHWTDGLNQLEALLCQPLLAVPKKTLATALNCAGALALYLSTFPASRDYYQRALAISQELGDTRFVATNFGRLALVAIEMADYQVAREYYEKALPMLREQGDKRGEAGNLGNLGIVCMETGDFAAAQECFEQSRTMNRELGDKRGEAANLGNLGIIAQHTGDLKAAREYFEQSQAMSRELGDMHLEAAYLCCLGYVVMETGDYTQSREYYESALVLCRDMGDRHVEASILGNLGILAMRTDENIAARRYLDQALVINREHGNRTFEAENIAALGVLDLRCANYGNAKKTLKEALTLSLEITLKPTVIDSLEAVGSLARTTSGFEMATTLYGAAHAARGLLGTPLHSSSTEDVERDLQACRLALGDAEYERCWAAGAPLTLEEAAALALSS